MNRANLKSYLNSKINREELKRGYIKVNDKCMITNAYSIIFLNDSNGLEVVADKYGLTNFKDSVEYDYNNGEFKSISELDNKIDFIPIQDGFEINMKEVKKISGVIKCNEYALRESKDYYNFYRFIIELRNTKSGEYAYLLPSKTY